MSLFFSTVINFHTLYLWKTIINWSSTVFTILFYISVWSRMSEWESVGRLNLQKLQRKPFKHFFKKEKRFRGFLFTFMLDSIQCGILFGCEEKALFEIYVDGPRMQALLIKTWLIKMWLIKIMFITYGKFELGCLTNNFLFTQPS